MKQGDFTPTDLLESVWTNIENGKHLNAWVSIKDKKDLLKETEEADKRFKDGKSKGELDGIPISIKDNIFVKGLQASAASRALEGFIAPVNATTTKRLVDQKAIVVGTSNMDEFGMGSYG